MILCVSSPPQKDVIQIDVIKKITPTGQISFVKSQNRFKDGRRIGDYGWSSSAYLYHYEPDVEELSREVNIILKALAIVSKNIQLLTVSELKEIATTLIARGGKL